jgi:hypothetical protein
MRVKALGKRIPAQLVDTPGLLGEWCYCAELNLAMRQTTSVGSLPSLPLVNVRNVRRSGFLQLAPAPIPRLIGSSLICLPVT